MISLSAVSKSFGAQTLFNNVSLQLNPGERCGLVGANGSGKTTLLNILAGDDVPSAGIVSIPKRLKLGLLRQDRFLHEQEEILGVVMMGNQELWDAMVQKEALLAVADDVFDADRFSELEDIILRHEGYKAEARAAEVLEGLGIPTPAHRQALSTLSGGFKLRVLLAQVLAGSPEVLLLDEPTNHLDILSIRWLEKFLQTFAGPVVVISHDHRFLDNVCTHTLDIDYQRVTLYNGNYAHFIEGKQAERERKEKEIDKREKEIAHHKAFVDRFRAKASKARQAQSKLRLIEKKAEGLEELPPSSRRYPRFGFGQLRPSGREALKLQGIRKSFADREVLHGVDLTVRRGDRLAIMGPNGIGKSTLLKIAMRELEPDTGTIEWGFEAHPGYFAQDHREQLEPPGQTAEAWVQDACPGESVGFVRNHMGRVLFSGDDAKKRLSALSGGEAARLVFCKIAIQQPNVLVLDEPTNHLDLESIEALVEGLKNYPGTLILVSHDRWFVAQLATRIVEIKPDEILDYEGSYEEYVHYCGDDHLDVQTVILKAKKQRTRTASARELRSKRPRNKNNKSLRRLTGHRDSITVRIEEVELRIGEITQTFCDPSFYQVSTRDRVRELEAERQRLEAELEKLMTEWQRAEDELALLE